MKWAPTQWRREGNFQEGRYLAGIENVQSKEEQESSGLQEGCRQEKIKRKQRISDMLFEYVEKKNYTLMKHLVKHVENQANKRCEILLKKSQKLERKYNQNTLFQTVVNVIYVLIM